MKNYIKHLLSRPLKLLWLLAMYTFTFLVLTYLWSHKKEIIDDNAALTFWALNILMLGICIVASLQPYKEYKDGL